MWPFQKPAPFRRVDDRFSVTGQLSPEGLSAIATAGFRTLICTRPDNEEPGQPSHAQIAQAAALLGLATHHIPVSGAPTPAQVAEMRAIMATVQGPVLGWCRSGARAETLHRMARD